MTLSVSKNKPSILSYKSLLKLREKRIESVLMCNCHSFQINCKSHKMNSKKCFSNDSFKENILLFILMR